MYQRLLLFALIAITMQSQAKSKACDSSIINDSTVIQEGGIHTHSLTYEDYKLKFGGPRETSSGSFDQDASKRHVLACTPGLVKCLKENQTTENQGEIWISFDLVPSKKKFQISNIKTTSEEFKSPKFHKCFAKVLKEMPLSLLPANSKTVSIQFPMQVN